jgi:hypothetical protein
MIRKEKLPSDIKLGDGKCLPFRRKATTPAHLDRLADEAKRQKLRFRKLSHVCAAKPDVRGLYLYTNKKLTLPDDSHS